MVDGNHMLAGQNLKFNVEVVAIREAPKKNWLTATFTVRTVTTTIMTTVMTVAAVVTATVTTMVTSTAAKAAAAVAVKVTAAAAVATDRYDCLMALRLSGLP